jgi:hypothetical protein
LAIGLSRTYRWAGYSAWELPLSVAQHSLTVLALCAADQGPRLSPAEQLRELVHDAVEALVGGLDFLTPLKPYLGAEFVGLMARLQDAVDTRYQLPPWTADSFARHKRADRLAAASEAFHVVGWEREAIRIDLGFTLAPVAHDPLPRPDGLRAWEPWAPKVAEQRFLDCLDDLLTAATACGAVNPPAGVLHPHDEVH